MNTRKLGIPKHEIEAGLAYALWLLKSVERKSLNEACREAGLPTTPNTVCLNALGERVFKRMVRITQEPGIARTQKAEIRSVYVALLREKGNQTVRVEPRKAGVVRLSMKPRR